MKKILKIIYFIFLSLCYIPEVYCQATESIQILPMGNTILIPMGRTFIDTNGFEVKVNENILPYEVIYDGYGGFWAKISSEELQDYSIINVRYIRKKETAQIFRHDNDISDIWIMPSKFIDSDNSEIIEQAQYLYDETKKIKDNVRSISDFVIGNIRFNQNFHHSPASLPASKTLFQKEGVCINFSRLCIALCRACGIPARSISGIILNKSNSKQYDFHHEWMEYMDEDGVWNPIDLTFTKTLRLNDIRYFDFVYAAEDQILFKDIGNKSLLAGKSFINNNNDIILFHYHPIFPGAQFGFQLIEDHQPDYIIFEKTILIKKYENKMIIIQSIDSSEDLSEKLEYFEELIELKNQLNNSSESESIDESIEQLPVWLMQFDGNEYRYENSIFRTTKVKFAIDFKKNELFLTVYNNENIPTTLKSGLARDYYLNINENGLLIAAKTTFENNVINWTTVIPEYNWVAKYTYNFSGEELEVDVVDINGNKYFTKGMIVE